MANILINKNDPTLASTAAAGPIIQNQALTNLGIQSVGKTLITASTLSAAQAAIGLNSLTGEARGGIALALAACRMHIFNDFGSWALTTGGGASTPSRNFRNVELRSGSGSANRTVGMQTSNSLGSGAGMSLSAFRAEINYSKPIIFGVCLTRVGVTANGFLLTYCGSPNGANAGWANPAAKSIGFRINSADVIGMAHNGNNISFSTSVGGLPSGIPVVLIAVADGTGRVDYYIESSSGISLPQTLLSGPLGVGPFGSDGIACQLSNGSDTGEHRIVIHSIFFYSE